MNDSAGFDVAIGASRAVLCFLGIWPDDERKNLISRIRFLLPSFIMLYFANIPQTIMAIKVWGDFNAVLEVLTISDISIAIALFKMLGLWYNKDVLGQLVVSMAADWRSSKSEKEFQIMWQNARMSRFMSITIILLAEGTIMAHFTMALYFTLVESKENSLMKLNATTRFRPLYMSAEFFYDIQSSPNYEIIWLFQFFSTMFAASAFSSVDAFFAVLVLHLCSQLNNLKEKLKDLPKKNDTEEVQSFLHALSAIVARHEALNKFANTIEESFNMVFLVQMVASSLMLILQGYQIVILATSEGSIQFFELIFMVYFTCCFTFSLFVYCYVAEVLRTESMEIGNAAYQCNWYTLLPSEAKCLTLIIIRAKQPFEITAGKFAAFSLELYCRILKTSGGYLSMLLAVKDRLAT